MLTREASTKRYSANGNNVSPENRNRLLAEAQIAETLAKISWDAKELVALRSRTRVDFLSLFRSAYAERALVIIGQLEGRLAINLADSLIQNAGISLDRCLVFRSFLVLLSKCLSPYGSGNIEVFREGRSTKVVQPLSQSFRHIR